MLKVFGREKKSSKLLLLSACLTTIASAAIADPVASSNSDAVSEVGAAKKPVLQGGINHAQELPALADSLRPGKIFSDDLLLKEGTESDGLWYYIPKWYAGTRHVDYANIVYRHDYKTGASTTPNQRQLDRQDSVSGYMTDKNGGIWDYKMVPAIQHVESDAVNAVIYVKKITPVMCTDDRIVINYNELSITTDKKNNKILQVFQQEQINTITSPEPGTLHIDISVKCFDPDGAPQRLEESVMIAQMTKPFEEKIEYKGQDLRPLFRNYLVSHSLEKLVPDSIKGP